MIASVHLTILPFRPVEPLERETLVEDKAAWQDLVRSDEIRKVGRDIPIEPSYSGQIKNTEEPGVFPYTRGRTSSGYRDRPWYIAQYAGFGGGADANERLREILRAGQTMLIVALDLPTQIGLDPDDSAAQMEVGRVGVSIASLRDINSLFEGISLQSARMCMVANAIGPLALSWFLAEVEHQGLRTEDVVVNLQNDPFKEFTGRGTYNVPLRSAVKLAADVVEYTAEHLPTWEPMNVCGSHLRWGGASSVEEIGFAVANTCAYLDELASRGIPISTVAPLIELHLSSGHEILEEVAKFRAARRLWAHVLRERYGITDDDAESLRARISVYTAGYSLTEQEPLNNVVRIALQCLSAVMGGVQYLNSASFDEALSIPSLDAAILSTRTQQIIALETDITDTIDPLGGSYAVETLTDQIEAGALALIAKVEAHGGAIAAVEQGFYQHALDEGAYRYQREIESGIRPIVGVNRFRPRENEESERAPDWRHEGRPLDRDDSVDVAETVGVRMQELRASRNERRVESALQELEAALKRGENSIPTTLEAVKSYATTGEVVDVWRRVFGVYHAQVARL